MTLHPEVQDKAQAEIDAVVGQSRLPTFSDRPNLPYVEAVIQEVLRIHTVAPISAWLSTIFICSLLITLYYEDTPHVANRDDIFQGYLIPKGSSVLVNLW